MEPIYAETGAERNARPWGAFTVAKPCPKADALPGRTVCITHGLTFRHNMERDGHVDNCPPNAKPCELAWWCTEHGMEEM